MREKESLEYGGIHISALKTKVLRTLKHVPDYTKISKLVFQQTNIFSNSMKIDISTHLNQ